MAVSAGSDISIICTEKKVELKIEWEGTLKLVLEKCAGASKELGRTK